MLTYLSKGLNPGVKRIVIGNITKINNAPKKPNNTSILLSFITTILNPHNRKLFIKIQLIFISKRHFYLKSDLMSKFKHKITVVGDGFVGKTSLIRKFTQKHFEEEYIKTVGANFCEYVVEKDGDCWELIFWDIAGQDDFHFLHPSFYKSSMASIIVFSLEENNLGNDSLKHVNDWYKEIKKFCGDIPMILFGNKVDLVDESKLDEEKMQKFIKKHNFIDYYHTSAKTGQNVEKAFQTIIEALQNRIKS